MVYAALPGPNFHRRLQQLLNKAPAETIKAWRRGHRRAPQWARDRLYEACAAIRNAANNAMDIEASKK
jgi:hypothetical protein